MPKVYFVGCGPGDPDLITVKAKKLIQKADVVVYSGSLIPSEILKLCKKARTYDKALSRFRALRHVSTCSSGC